MSRIPGPIGQRQWELIRDRIGLILAEELATQAQLDYDDQLFINPSVYVERFKPFNHTEMPAVNVMVAQNEYTQETQQSQDGTHTYYVDMYVNAKASAGLRGDELAAKKLHRLVGMCQAILMDSRFKTLLFEPGGISNRSVKRIQMADPTKSMEAANTIMARMTVEVRATDNVELVDAIPLDEYVTIAKMGATGEGYLWGGSTSFTPDTGCADSVLNVNGVFLSNIPSGEEFNLVVVDTLGNQVGEAYGNTITVPTAECLDVDITVNGNTFGTAASGSTFNVSVVDQDNNAVGVIEPGPLVRVEVTPDVIIYQEARYMGEEVSYADGDAVWRRDNNKLLALTQPQKGIMQRLQAGSEYLLEYNNVFNNKYMITGPTGGYYNPIDGNYYDVTGSVVTRGDVFPDEFGVDHLCNRLVQTLQVGTKPWASWCVDGLTLTIGGFTEWYLPMLTEVSNYPDFGLPLSGRDTVPFDWGNGGKLLANTYTAGSTQALTLESYGQFRSLLKTNNNRAIYIKPIDINTVFG